MGMYVKLFASLYQGTLRGCSDEILVFTNLLAHADQYGIVDKHWRAISEETGLSRERVEAAINKLEAPDPESRSPEHEGRRIVRLDEHRAWGWQVVNYGKYRAIRNEDDRRIQNREAQQRYRDRHKPDKPRKPMSAHTEAEADTKAVKHTPPAVSLPSWLPEDAWKDFVEMRKKIRAPLTNRAAELVIAKLGALKAAGHDPITCLNTSIEKSWRSVFAPAEEKKPGGDWTATDQSILAKAKEVGVWSQGKDKFTLIREIKEKL